MTLNRPENKEDNLLSSQEIKFDEFLAAQTFCSSGTCPNLAKIMPPEYETGDEFLEYQSQWSGGSVGNFLSRLANRDGND